MYTRRQFIKALAATAGYSILPLSSSGFAMSGDGTANHRLVVLLLRGAVDGLSVVVPYKEKNYYASRQSIALQPPGASDSVLDLDGFFGLNPSLGQMMPLWQNRSLAFVHASGYPTNLRSHFAGQDIIETASLNSAPRGWMNSLALMLPDTHSPTRALSFTKQLPKIFTGSADIAMVPPGIKADSKMTFQNPKVEAEFSALYAGNPQLAALFKEATDSRDKMIDDLQKEMVAASGGAPYPDGFPGQAVRLAAMIKQDPNIELAFIDLGGWDTHVNQGNSKGQLAGKLQKLGEGLATLAADLGNQYQNTTIMVMSEFGRTVAENGNGGTDHGHGNVIWIMGGGIQGGKVHGEWPGLDREQLFEERDLAITTDFRTVIGSVLQGSFGLSDTQIAKAIPDYTPNSSLRLFA